MTPRRVAAHARREDPTPPGPDPRPRRQRLRRRQPDAVARSPSAATSTARPPASRPGGSRTCPTTTSGMVDLLIDSNLDALLDEIRPRTVFNCVAYGAYSFETDSQLIYRTNFKFLTRLLLAAGVAVDRLLRPRRQLLRVRRQRRRAGRARPAGAQQRLRRLQGRRRQPDLLLRQAQEVPLRQPPALLGLRPARGLGPADPQPDPPRRWRARTRRSSIRPSRATSSTSTT